MKNRELAVLEFRLNSGAEEIIAFKEILANDINNKNINEDRDKLTWYEKLIKHLYSEFSEGDLPEYYSYKGKLRFKEE